METNTVNINRKLFFRPRIALIERILAPHDIVSSFFLWNKKECLSLHWDVTKMRIIMFVM